MNLSSRSILRVVFTINVTPDDIPDGPEPGTIRLNPDLSPVDDPENQDLLEETEVDGNISFTSPPLEGAEQSEAASLVQMNLNLRKMLVTPKIFLKSRFHCTAHSFEMTFHIEVPWFRP